MARADDPHGAKFGGGFVERFRRSWRNELCAMHDGSIMGFGGSPLATPDTPIERGSYARHWRAQAGGDFLRHPRTFEFSPIQIGTGAQVVVINGFMNESEIQVEEWRPALEALYPDNPWFHLRWESKNPEDLIGLSRKDPLGSSAVAAAAIGFRVSALALAASMVWPGAMHKAEQTGTALADVILRSDRDFVLCGHSLGARVIFYCLRVLSLHRHPRVVRVHLLGGAVGNHRSEWDEVKDATLKGIVNYYSRHDQVLKILYEAGSAFSSTAIGRSPITVASDLIINVDVSEAVAGHSHYKAHFASYASRLGLA